MRFNYSIYITILVALFACANNEPDRKEVNATTRVAEIAPDNPDSIRTIHLFVALCDNKYQGIVPVPASIGNGQNPNSNLYWGAGYGIKTHFGKSSEWKLVSRISLSKQKWEDSTILETLVYRHSKKPIYLLADAYNGKHIKQTTVDFLEASAGRFKREFKLSDGRVIQFGGRANLSAYIGHNGLMDFEIEDPVAVADTNRNEAIMLACYSKSYFKPFIQRVNAKPVLWSTHLMAPEAYIIHDALREWCANKSNEEIRTAAAKAYSKYQKCSENAAKRLLVTRL